LKGGDKVAKSKEKSTQTTPKKRRSMPALTPEARENQLIALAYNAAEEQMLNGTASSQVITHFLKLGSSKAELEKSKLEYESKLLEAKTEALVAAKRSEEMYQEVINAIREYSGIESKEDEDLY